MNRYEVNNKFISFGYYLGDKALGLADWFDKFRKQKSKRTSTLTMADFRGAMKESFDDDIRGSLNTESETLKQYEHRNNTEKKYAK